MSTANFPESGETTITKISLLRNTSQNSDKKHEVKVFFMQQQSLKHITLPFHSLTVTELTSESLKEFNEQLDLGLSQQTDKWILYASKKNGKKYNDLPGLDPSQNIEKIGYTNFLLMPENKSPRKSVSGGRIKTQFCQETRKQVLVKEKKSCLCFQF